MIPGPVRLLLLPLLLVLPGSAPAGTGASDTPHRPRPRDRAVVEMGGDSPSPEYVRDHLREMERRPFDGVVLNLKVPRTGYGIEGPGTLSAFQTTPLVREDLRLPVLESIQWGRFRENFLLVFAQDWWTRDMDWFDEAQWGVIRENARLTGEAVGAGRLRGIIFDPEAYFDPDPWRMPDPLEGRSEAEVRAMVRRRGREYMEGLQAGRAEVTVVCLGLFSISHSPAYTLLADFGFGLLEGANPGSIVSDTPEITYWATRAMDLYWSHRYTRERARELVPPELADRLADRYRADSILYLNAMYGPDAGWDRDRMLTHNVYHGLVASDAIAIVWSDSYLPIRVDEGTSGNLVPNWWTGTNLPEGAIAAVRTARRRLARGGGLGFSFNIDPGGAVVEDREPVLRIGRVNGGRSPEAGAPFEVEVRVRGEPWDFLLPYADGETIGQGWATAGDRVSVPFAPLPEGIHTVMVEMYRSEPYASVVSAPVVVRVRPAVPR